MFLAESSFIRIINKMLEHNKKAWDSHLKYALWAERISTKRSHYNYHYHYNCHFIHTKPLQHSPILLKRTLTKLFHMLYNNPYNISSILFTITLRIFDNLLNSSPYNILYIKQLASINTLP